MLICLTLPYVPYCLIWPYLASRAMVQYITKISLISWSILHIMKWWDTQAKNKESNQSIIFYLVLSSQLFFLASCHCHIIWTTLIYLSVLVLVTCIITHCCKLLWQKKTRASYSPLVDLLNYNIRISKQAFIHHMLLNN